MKLLPEEIVHLETIYSSGRCSACGHLEGFHNEHCCTFCTIEDCECFWGEVGPDIRWNKGTGKYEEVQEEG